MMPLQWSACAHCHRPAVFLLARHGTRGAWSVCALHVHTDWASHVIGRRIDTAAGDVNA